ncbi:MAG: 2-oxo-4-hydroxy-4-carboxy-5-ureidoimidazoline decarboxylase, partial [Silicimonas sp.]|nr:2-oxo-4-hydroxy-4-carboxy-5-ureidoimidazoline decarboxylase [Silicimonas sp.]
GAAGAPKMLSIGLHCRLIGRPGRAAALRRVIQYMQSHEGVWFATRLEIAEHWAKENPAVSNIRPSEMSGEDFVSEFGGIFEHSPWIAEGAHALELGPTHDTAQGVHQALARIFRVASEEKRLGVLTAHPDLAGKLAAAGKLTAESTSEQAGAGLDMLTDEERTTFQDLNAQYVKRHGFPFIIAVRDHTKPSIMEAFKQRIRNDREAEFSEACRQVERIAELRLEEKFAA